MKTARWLVLLALFAGTAGAATTHNDDTCDIATFPAATLLLPYFEVDLAGSDDVAFTTLFTVVNVTNTPQIANVTLWTDWAYPALSFDLFLTGYDVQAVNLRDVLVRGQLATPGNDISRRGSRSREDNPNFLPNAVAGCGNAPLNIDPVTLADVSAALATGRTASCPGQSVGAAHTRAAGYVTIDVVATCSTTLPNDAQYFDELLYDNVLTGDYELVSPNRERGNFAGGSPLVHIRAIPEGGRAGTSVATHLPHTFYERLVGPVESRNLSDRRQPLPSAFLARYFQGGSGGFFTDVLFWREALTPGGALCDVYAMNQQIVLQPVVRFDERENPTVSVGGPAMTRVAERIPTVSSFFPPLTSGDIGGWIYLNLHNGRKRASQNWAVIHMSAEGRYSVAKDAAMLANGCTPPLIGDIAPGPNATP